MDHEEIQSVLSVLLNPRDPSNIVSTEAPLDAVRSVVEQKKFKWSDMQIRIVASLLGDMKTPVFLEAVEGMVRAEEIIEDTIRSSKMAYWITLIIHNVTFYLGITLIVAAVYASYIGLNLFSVALGGVGFGTVILLFLRQPISGVHRSIGSLIQLEVIYCSYIRQLGFWGSYAYEWDEKKKSNVLQEIKKCTNQTVDLIEKHCK